MEHKILTRITACLIAALSVMVTVACSGALTQGTAGASSTAAASGQTAAAQPQSGESAQAGGAGLYNLSGGSASKTGETLNATEDDQSAVLVTGDSLLTMSGMKITTIGNTSSMDSSSFYGLNAAVLAKAGSEISLADSTVETTGTGANGVFAAGENARVKLSNVTIQCKATGAHGVDATLGGTLTLENVNITTAGDGAAAAIATDRGGGTITVTGGTVLTTGAKSPAIYSTGSITATGAAMKATGSEAVVIEGKNSVTLADCTMEGGKNYGVLIYQSMSGDADVGSGSFTMAGGILTAAEGPLFYSTNTTAVISLKNVALSGTGVLLKAGADQWGQSGANGSQVWFTADTQKLLGDVVLDNISTADITLVNGSSLNGAINSANTAKSVTITLDKTSAWNVTEDSYVNAVTDADGTLSNITGSATVYYDSTNDANAWLGGKTFALAGGGELRPMQ